MAHIHEVKDIDAYFVIDPISRKITNPSDDPSVMQNDHNSEIIGFKIPHYIEGHDMLQSNLVQVHYVNEGVGTSKSVRGSHADVYDITDLTVCPDDEEYLVCTWPITKEATQYSGTIKFKLKFICFDNDETDPGYILNTPIFSAISVGESFDNSNIVVEQNSDIILQFEERISTLENGGVSSDVIASAIDKYLESNPIMEEKDPTVSDWAKQPEKPTYTAKEVGALPDTTEIPSLNGYATEQFVRDEITNIGLVEKLPRPGVNLLHNADWAYSLVNQRGHSGVISGTYCLDRWIGNGTVTPDAGKHVTLSAGTTMIQRLEIVPAALFGKRHTFSIDVGGTIQTTAISFPVSADAAVNVADLPCGTVELGFISGSFQLCGVDCAAVPYIKITTNLAINVRRVFLELGEASHMTATPPTDYATALLICSRYFRLYQNAVTIMGHPGYFHTAAQCRIILNLGTPMRIKNTLLPNTDLTASDVTVLPGGITVSALSIGYVSDDKIILMLTITGGTAGNPCVARIARAFYFSAEL